MYNTKAQAHKAAKKVLERLGNKNWQITVRDGMGYGGYTYALTFHKGLLSLYPTTDDTFTCLFTFDESSPGVGDSRFHTAERSSDPLIAVEAMLRQVRTTVDKEVYELNVVDELMASPKRRQPW